MYFREIERCSRQKAEGSSSWLSAREIMYRPNCYCENHHRAIARMEFFLYITFIDFVKAFDSLDRDSLWKLMRHYGIPEKFMAITKNTYEGMSCKVLHEGTLTDKIKVKTGMRQGCLLSPFLFLLAVDWIMKESTEGRRNGIQ